MEAGTQSFSFISPLVSSKWNALSSENRKCYSEQALLRNRQSDSCEGDEDAPSDHRRINGGFMYFHHQVKSSVLAQYPGSTRQELMSVTGAMWRNLPEEDKDSFKVLAQLNFKPKDASSRTPKSLKRRNFSGAVPGNNEGLLETPQRKVRRRVRSCASVGSNSLTSSSASPVPTCPTLVEEPDDTAWYPSDDQDVPCWMKDHDYCLPPSLQTIGESKPCLSPAPVLSPCYAEHSQQYEAVTSRRKHQTQSGTGTTFEPVDMYFGEMARLYLHDVSPLDKAEFERYLAEPIPKAIYESPAQFSPYFYSQPLVQYSWDTPCATNYCLTNL